MEVLERKACLTGVGQSQVGRRLMCDPLALTLDACMAAIEDAGLRREDIDGLSTYPGAFPEQPGFSGAGIIQVHDALRLRLNWFTGGVEMPGQFGSVINACMAVATGLARHVLCFRSLWESSAQGAGGRAGMGLGGAREGGSPLRVSSEQQWLIPFRAYSPANWLAMYAQRHFHEFGTTREQMAQIALNGRKNAQLNPKAVYREPLSMDDYLGARMISTPFCLYDCDVPVDGATAVIVSHVDAAKDCRRPPIHVEAVGCALHGRPSWYLFDDLTTMSMRDAARMLWRRTDLKPGDVDLAELYDGFSFLSMAWLEALGFCAKGESGPFVEGGGRIALEGELPLNTHGGQLSAGRLHGYGFLHEACVQLWGDAGERQVAGSPEVALASAGGGAQGACMLLTR